MPYPWVIGDAHMVIALTNTGTAFEHEIAVAVPTPQPTATQLWPQALVGLIVGVLPVAVGLLFYPALRGVGQSGMTFLLALTVGLLAFLLVDTWSRRSSWRPSPRRCSRARAMVVLAGAASFLILLAVGRRRGTPAGLALAFFIALGIGLHNFGEGLAIGASFATGAAGLGTFLVARLRHPQRHRGHRHRGAHPQGAGRRSGALSHWRCVAGLPAVFGMWLGSLAYAPQWSALALAIGAGAILQVIIEVGAYLMRSSSKGSAALFSLPGDDRAASRGRGSCTSPPRSSRSRHGEPLGIARVSVR